MDRLARAESRCGTSRHEGVKEVILVAVHFPSISKHLFHVNIPESLRTRENTEKRKIRFSRRNGFFPGQGDFSP